jgi:hypothetical protein
LTRVAATLEPSLLESPTRTGWMKNKKSMPTVL